MLIFSFFFLSFLSPQRGAVIIEVCGRNKDREIKTFLGGGIESIENCEICLGCRECCGTFQLSL